MTATSPMLTVHIPLMVRWRGGRKVVIAPDGTEAPVIAAARIDSALVKALARAFRWRRMLESGVVSTVGEIATREKINKSYVSRVLRLTLLAPDIVEAILDGRQATEVTLRVLLKGFPVEWSEQEDRSERHSIGPHGLVPADFYLQIGWKSDKQRRQRVAAAFVPLGVG